MKQSNKELYRLYTLVKVGNEVTALFAFKQAKLWMCNIKDTHNIIQYSYKNNSIVHRVTGDRIKNGIKTTSGNKTTFAQIKK